MSTVRSIRRDDAAGEDPLPYLFRGRDAASAIYGLVIAMSVVAAFGQEARPDPLEVLITVVTSSMVFWAAHAYANLLGERIQARHPATWARRRAMLWHSWPIVEAAYPAAVILLLATLSSLRGSVAIDVILGLSLLELAVIGFVAARRGAATTVPAALVSSAFTFALGLAIVILKVLLH